MLEQKSVNLKSQGVVISVRGSVVDIRFVEHLPPSNSQASKGSASVSRMRSTDASGF